MDIGDAEMKILIEESVLRQALEALIDFNQQSIGGIALPAEIDTAITALRTALDNQTSPTNTDSELCAFKLGDMVRKVSGSEWEGVIVGTYSTELTPEGYCVESMYHKGSVQIYPAKALEKVDA